MPSTMMALFEKVELTEDESHEALLKAKVEKYGRIQEEEQKAARQKDYEEVTRAWTTEETFKNAYREAKRLAALSKKEHVMDADLLPVFNILSQYFSNDARFEKGGRSLSKGIMLIGNVGVGKTDLLQAFARNRRQCFTPVTCNEIEAKCRQNGIEYWNVYTGNVPGYGKRREFFYQPAIGWMFDDLGVEEIIKTYGNNLDALEKIIHQRYMDKERVPFSSLHMTTNLNGDMMEHRYGYRFRSRIRDMFNVIELSGTDRRK